MNRWLEMCGRAGSPRCRIARRHVPGPRAPSAGASAQMTAGVQSSPRRPCISPAPAMSAHRSPGDGQRAVAMSCARTVLAQPAVQIYAGSTYCDHSLDGRCCHAPGAASVLLDRRPECGRRAASMLCGSVSPLSGATQGRSSGLRAFVPPRMRDGATGTPSLYPAERLQDKSRTVRPGRTAKERRRISAQPQCALSHGNVRFQEMSARSTGATHRTNSTPVDRVRACDRVRLGYSIFRRGRG
jgi:hypothetical protein